MKLLAINLAFAGLMCFFATESQAQEQEQNVASMQKLSGIELSIVSHKRKYKRSEQLKVDVMLKNSRQGDVYVFGTLGWGYAASLVLHIRDVSGREIEPIVQFDARTLASPDEKEAFLKLRPNHFVGTTFFSPLEFLGLKRPGRYAIEVEYNSPFSIAEVELKPYFGKESSPLRSNVVWIEVVR